nr:MAG TPA: Oligosaccaryltransferase [Caudoviricetes sp.]
MVKPFMRLSINLSNIFYPLSFNVIILYHVLTWKSIKTLK